MTGRRGMRLCWLVVVSVLAMVGGAWPAAAAPSRTPGTVQSVAPLPRELGIPGAADAVRLTYWTTDRDGRAVLSSGALFLPAGPAPVGGWPVVSWAHGTVGIADDCAPSRTPRTDRDKTYLSRWLSEGYAIVATDYAGLGTPGVHEYLEGVSEAHSVIDMVRAGINIRPALSHKWFALGQSQGGHATLYAASIATSYAPELDYRGAVTTGAPSNLESVLPLGGPYIPSLGLDGLTVFSTYILAGLRAADPGLDVNRYLTPKGVELVDSAERLCYDDQARLATDVSVGALLNQSLEDPSFRAAVTRYIAIPTAGYSRPLFIAQGLLDTTVPAPLSFALIAQLRANGVNATYRNYPTGHDGTMAASLPDTTVFARQLFAS